MVGEEVDSGMVGCDFMHLDQIQFDAFKFVVIGGGSAGCLIARELAASNVGQVLLIEASPARNDMDVRTVVPAYYARTFASRLDWSFATVQQPSLGGRKIQWPRGRALGGCGAINALIHLHAAPGDFDRWAAAGCSGWDWNSIRQNLRNDSADNLASTVCPVSGLPLCPIAAPHVWTQAFLNAAREFGLRAQYPLERSEANCCGIFQLTQQRARRVHTGRLLMNSVDAGELPQLTILRSVTIERLELAGDRVSQLQLTQCDAVQGVQRTVQNLSSDCEIILAAGAIGSPQILLQSGIGPSENLRELRIEVQHALKGVGENLQDHLVYPVVMRATKNVGLPPKFHRADRERYRKASHDQDAGPMASNLAEACALIGENQTCCPETQIHFTPTHYLKYPSHRAPTDYFSLAVTDLHPRSRGQLTLTRTASGFTVQLDPAYLNEEEDKQRLLDGVECCRQIASLGELRSIALEEAIPGQKRVDRSAILRSIQTFAQSIYHPVGTCRMGGDESAVVDSKLRVHGLSNLRIADASVLPDLPSANTQATTLLIAARCVQFALGD